MKTADNTIVLRVLFVAGLACSAAAAVAQDNLQHQTLDPTDDLHARQTFDQLDLDGDGAITRAELPDDSDLAKRFDRLDGDRDGRLSREEFNAADAAFEDDDAG